MPMRGQSPKLFVKLRAGQHAEPEEIREFLAHLSQQDRAAENTWKSATSLPRTLVGKLSKKELVEEERS